MSDTLGLSTWLTSFLKPPVPAPAAAPASPDAPVADELPMLVPAAPHPNLVALLDRARAREAVLHTERAALEPKLTAACVGLGVLAAGAFVGMDRLGWGLFQWHSGWHVALLVVPNALGLALAARWARDARRAIGELLAERRFPVAGQNALSEPLAATAQHPDALFAALIQDMHATNNALELSLRKQQEKFHRLMSQLGRLGAVLVLQTAFNVAASHLAVAAPAPAKPAPAAAASVAPTAAPPSPAPSLAAPVASPVSRLAPGASASPLFRRRPRHPAHPAAPVAPAAIAPAQPPIQAPDHAAPPVKAEPVPAAPVRVSTPAHAQTPDRPAAPAAPAAPVAVPAKAAVEAPARAAAPAHGVTIPPAETAPGAP